jgi:hypothetical protein
MYISSHIFTSKCAPKTLFDHFDFPLWPLSRPIASRGRCASVRLCASNLFPRPASPSNACAESAAVSAAQPHCGGFDKLNDRTKDLSGERVGFTDKIFIFVCLEVFNTQTYEYESSY